ncbi:hypothetical protein C0993_010813 [Termitomyces sp. T159_Od127]|nr:hypothetical protein C0993_010813 [Termitomyces sp. T159_Od127]
MQPIGVAVLTVSDTASRGLAEDKSGPAIQEIVKAQGARYASIESICVPDDISQIQAAVKKWAEHKDIDWIITTGGTGFGAVKPLLEREASGLVHLLLSASLKYTPLAALSRPIAGTIGTTLVVTLPGSVKAVKENMDALLNAGLVEHAIDLARGGTGKQVHDQLAKDTEVDTITRPIWTRQSPYPLVSTQQALHSIERNVNRLGLETRRVDHDLRGYVLATDVAASQDVPRLPSTNVDGYAVRSTDPPGIYKVLTSQTHSISQPVPPDSVFRVNTGGPLPAGSDAVIMVEDTRLISTYKESDGGLEGEENEIETLVQVPGKENIRFPGTDVQVGDIVLQKGDIIKSGGGEVGTLAFVGMKEVEVYKKPIVALLSTGNELIDLQDPVSRSGNDWGGIYDTNRPSLRAAIEGMGYEVVDLGIVPDEFSSFLSSLLPSCPNMSTLNSIESHVAAIQRGLQSADILLTTGGTSMGPTDLLKPVIERHFNGTIHFGRVSMKPGKPTTFATMPYENIAKPAFALPGNPASALVTFYLFVVPALRLLGGWKKSQAQLPRVLVRLQSEMYLDPRTEFHRVVVSQGPNGLVAVSTGGQRSSRVASLSGANGLAIVPPKTDSSPLKLEVGSQVEVVIIGEIQQLY